MLNREPAAKVSAMSVRRRWLRVKRFTVLMRFFRKTLVIPLGEEDNAVTGPNNVGVTRPPFWRRVHLMKRPHPAWLFTIFVLALLPAGFRMLTWRTPRHAEVDNDMARAGEVLFNHEWKPSDMLAQGGDGLGPVFNATSCKACHNQGGVGGGGSIDHNVTAFIVQNKGEEKA